MKGVLKRKILKMMGLVFGIAFGFSGAVVGVMAAMGKFKTPTVYPTVLGFENTEQIIIEGKTFNPDLDWEIQFEDEERAPTIESFVLSGKNPNFEHPVNKTKCYLWFVNPESAELITLCDKDGHLLIPDRVSGRYLVDCNEPIYYMVNEVADNAEIDGRVELMARSTNETLKLPEESLVIWIDRKVESIFVDYEQSEIDERNLMQEVSLGIDMALDFDYIVNTPLSLLPINKDGVRAKDIELYYNVEGMNYGTDFVKVTKEEVDKESSPLHSILTYVDDGNNVTFTFKTDSLERKAHTFYIAVFPTYADKENYENYILENSITNFDKLNKTDETDTVYMTYTTLKVCVEDIEISRAGLNGESVELNLFSEDSFIYLDNESDPNNLGLYMKKGIGNAQVDDYTRFSEVVLNGFNGDIWSIAEPKFVNGETEWDNTKTKQIVTTNLTIAENLKVIDYIIDETDEAETKYYCSNGVAVLDSSDGSIKLLRTGSYLDFYVYNGSTGEYTPATFEYDAVESGTGRNKKWGITPKTLQELSQGESLRIALLVVNNSGEFKFSNYFDAVPVSLNEQPLSVQYKDYEGDNVKFNASSKSATFNITFDYNGENVTNYPVLKCEDIINEYTGSYKSFVYVVEEGNNIVETINNITYVANGKTYVVVGSVDEITGKFVNEIRINGNVSFNNQTCQIYMLQLRHEYQQTIYDIITETVLNDGLIIDENQVANLVAESITINGKYILNTSLITYDNGSGGEDYVEVYENISGRVITVTALHTEMLDKVLEFNDDGLYIDCTEEYRSRIVFGEVTFDGVDLKIEYNVKEGNNTKIDIWVRIGEDQFDIGSVVILDGTPESVVLRYDAESDPIVLHTSMENAKNDPSNNNITAVLEHDGTNFNYSFTVNGTVVDGKDIFNKEIAFEATGFQDGSATNKQQSFRIGYAIKGDQIFDVSKIAFGPDGLELQNGLILADGEAVLQVTIDSVVGFIKLITDTRQFSLSPKTEGQTDYNCETQVVALSSFVSYKYNETTNLAPSAENLLKITNVKSIEYGDGELGVSFDESTNSWMLKKNNDADPILTISNDENGWKFSKSNHYVALKVAVYFDTIAPNSIFADKPLTIEFRSSVTISVTECWETNDRSLYAGTTISIVGNENSLFTVEKLPGVSIEVQFKIKEPQMPLASTYEVTDDFIGADFIIVPIIGGTDIDEEFTFVVKPNIVATPLTTTITSESSNSLEAIYELKQYNTAKVYGDNALYEDSELVSLADNSVLSFKVEQSQVDDNLTISGGANITVGEMVSVNNKLNRNISLMYREYIEVRKDLFEITNKHSVVIDNSNDESEETKLVFKALKEYDIFASVSGFELQSIDLGEGFTVDLINGDKFVISSIVTEAIEDVDAKLTFKKSDSEQIIEYIYQLDVIPYTPEEKSTISQAFSGADYDLLKEIYNVSTGTDADIEKDENILSLMVTGVKLENSLLAENVASDLIKNWNDGGSGYIIGYDKPACAIVFEEISGKELQVYIEFTITYINDKTYTYYIPLKVNNRQEIVVKYPEDTTHSTGFYKFLNGYEADALHLSGESEVSPDYIYAVNGIAYEPVLVYTNSETTINLIEKGVKKIERVNVTNNVVSENSSTKNVKIELIAYQNNGGMAEYVNKLKVLTHSNNTIKLPSAQQGMFGTLIFKLTTDSKNFAYYNIYIYCKGSNDSNNVNTLNNVRVFAHDGRTSKLTPGEDVEYSKDVNGRTYSEVVSNLENFTSQFGTAFNSNTTKIYLYDIEVTGESNYSSALLNKELTTEIITLDSKFKTITLGLVRVDGVQIFSFGTITLYAQPTVDVSTTMEYELPNGYFTADVDADAPSIASPFGTSWTPEILSIDGVAGANSNYQVSGSAITLNERVDKDTEIKVSYTNSGTVAIVTYTYKATRIPDLANPVVTVGHFVSDSVGFKTELDLKSTTEYQDNIVNNEYFFGTYAGDYTVEVIEGTNIDAETRIDENIITFTQTNEEQIFKIKITYSDLNSDNKTKIFTIKLLSGVHFVTEPNSYGLTSTNKLNSTKLTTDLYSGLSGSSITFEKEEKISDKLYKFTVQGSGLHIYTNVDSKLVLTFDRYNYVVNTNGNGVLTNVENIAVSTNNSNVNFVHSAADTQPITMTMNIESLTDDKLFAQRNLYLNIAKTYSTLKPVYLIDGADHQNVVSGSKIEKLEEDLLKTISGRNKIILVDNSGADITTDFDLTRMGFIDNENPNKLELSINAYATLKTNSTNTAYKDIQFNSVDKNVVCNLYLNNNAGIEVNTVVYNYQIMVSSNSQADGLDYTATTGYKGEYTTTGATPVTVHYVSFVLNDRETKYANNFVIGKMKDLNNKTVFTSNVFTDKKVISDGKYVGGAEAIGEFENGIQYEKTEGSYKLYLVLDIDTSLVNLFVERTSGSATSSNIVVSNINIGGVNGGDTIANNLTIVLSNHKIDEKYSSTVDNHIYAGFNISLFEDTDADGKYDNGKFVENEGVDADSTADGYQTALTYVLADSTYTIAGQTYTILASQTNNNLFNYNQNKKEIQTNAVASDVYAEINFLVKSGNYVIKTVNYKLNIYLNMKFVVNNDENSALETDFIITNFKESKTENGEPVDATTNPAVPYGYTFLDLNKNFIDGSQITTTDIKQTTKTTYYKVLAYDLYRIKSQNNQYVITKNDVEITLNSAIDPDVLRVTNTGIQFFKDYSGEIELKLSVQTKNGTFVQYWTIYVTPILDIDLAKTETSILQTGASSAFDSGTQVDLISSFENRNGEGIGVVVKPASEFTESITNRYEDESSETVKGILVNYSYRIYRFVPNSGISGLTSKEIYSIADDSTNQHYSNYITTGNSSGNLNGTIFKITLPNVPGSLDVQSYLVVYKVYAEYLGLTLDDETAEVFYVTYNVINKQKVDKYDYKPTLASEYLSSDDVNVSTRVYSSSGVNYLDLLYYKEEVSNGETYTLLYTGNKIMLNSYEGSVEGNMLVFKAPVDSASLPTGTNVTGLYTENSGSYRKVTDPDATAASGTTYYYEFKYNLSNRELSKQKLAINQRDQYEILGTTTQTPFYSTTYYSVFSSNFANILEYKNFIDLYLNKKSVRLGDQKFEEKTGLVAGETIVTGYYEYVDNKYVEITEASKKAETGKTYYQDIRTFSLVEISAGRYGINLSEHSTAIFNNELNERLSLIVGDVETVTLNDFRIVSNNSIKPTGSVYTLDQLGLINYFTPTSYWNPSLKIIGVGTPTDVSWVDGATSFDVSTDTNDYGIISIPNGTENNTYKIKKVTYSGSGVADYYSISQSYYYIVSDADINLIVPNYTGVETYLHSISYNPNASGNIELDLTKAINVWAMSDDKLVNVSSTATFGNDEEAKNYGWKVIDPISGITNPTFDRTNKKLTLAANVLVEYKLNNPTAYSYPRITASLEITYGGNQTTLEMLIEFALPLNVQFNATKVSSNYEVSLPFEADDITLTQIDEDYLVSYESEKLTLNGEKIEEYFAENTNENQFILTVKSSNGSVFEVVVDKPVA